MHLVDMVAPMSPSDFLNGPWPEQAWWCSSNQRRADLLAAIPELESAESVLRSAHSVGVFVSQGRVRMVEDADEAVGLYRDGYTCFLRSDHIAQLQASTERIAAEIGLPSGSMHTEIFVSHGDSGASMHSDYDLNFAVLARGKKKWRLAPNEHISNQVGQCFPGPHEQLDSVNMLLADATPFPAEMPEDTVSVEVSSGGIVFVPRGWWHETVSSGECLQVNFVVKRYMWLTVLNQAIRNTLLKIPEWRGYALDVFAEGTRQGKAMEGLALMLPRLQHELQELLGGDAMQSARKIVEASSLKAVNIS